MKLSVRKARQDESGMILVVASSQEEVDAKYIVVDNHRNEVRGFYATVRDANASLDFEETDEPPEAKYQWPLKDTRGNRIGHVRRSGDTGDQWTAFTSGQGYSDTTGSLEMVLPDFYATVWPFPKKCESPSEILPEVPELQKVVTYLPNVHNGYLIKVRFSERFDSPSTNRYIACDFVKVEIRGFYKSQIEALASLNTDDGPVATLRSLVADVFPLKDLGGRVLAYLQRSVSEVPWTLYSEGGDFLDEVKETDQSMRELRFLLSKFYATHFPVTVEDLNHPWVRISPDPDMAAPVRSFAEMGECLKQWRGWMLADHELILALQCSEQQVELLLALNKLPYTASAKLNLADLDGD